MTSTDIYSYLVTFSLVIVSIFLCWALFYCILILRRVYRMLDAIEDCLKSWSDSFESLVHRFTTMRDSLQLLVQGVKTASSVYQRYTGKSSKKISKQKKEDSGE